MRSNTLFLPNRPHQWQWNGFPVVWPAGILISMWSFSCQFVFNQIWTMEADNEIPESRPESSSAFWSFCLAVALSVLCNLLPESCPGHQEAADACYLNILCCFLCNKCLKRSLHGRMRCQECCTSCRQEEAKESRNGLLEVKELLCLCHSLLTA